MINRIDIVSIPVSDQTVAKQFYVDVLGFDDTDDVVKAHAQLTNNGLEISEIQDAPWGKYATFSDPDGNGWVLQQAVYT